MLFILGFLLSLSLCLDLGIVNIQLIKVGMEQGFKPSFILGVGSCIGDLVYALFSMIGISYLLEFTVVHWLLWIFGTLVLLYLSIQMIRETIHPKSLTFSPSRSMSANRSLWKTFAMGAGLALASPSAILWFTTAGGSMIASSTDQSKLHPLELFLFFLGFFCAGLLWSVVIAYLSALTQNWIGPRMLRIFSLVSAVLFLYFAIHVFLNGFRFI